MSQPLVHFERRERTALLTLDRPGRLNAVGSDMIGELDDHLDRIEADAGLRAVVITGAGRAFSAGADISELDTFATPDDFARFVNRLTDAYDRIERLPKPVIAAINGFALGGGCELALACDLRIAAPGAKIGLPEVKLGVMPGAAGTQRISRLLPAGLAKFLLMTGEPMSSADAERFGLVNQVADDCVSAAVGLAHRLSDLAPMALAAAKRLVDRGREMPLEAAIVFERETVTALFSTEDRQEGLTAFLEKRPPKFTGS